MTNTTDHQALLTQIIEAGRLLMRLWRMQDDDADSDQAGIAFEAALAQLASEHHGAVFMVSKLLAGSPFSVTSNTPENIRLCIAVARKLGATVKNSNGDFDEALPTAYHTISITPAPLRESPPASGAQH